MNYLPETRISNMGETGRLMALRNAVMAQNVGFTPLRPVKDYTVENQLHSKFLQVPEKSRELNPPNRQAVDNLKFLLRR